MLDRVGEWATALTGVVSLPVWAVVGIGAVLVLACALALVRAGGEGRSVPVVVLVLIVALAGWWARDHFARRDLEAEQRALDTRAFELATRAFMPGSALGCLDAIAGETVEEACEKAVFASPEATAAAVSYVAAQLSLLASARDLGRAGRTNSATLALRRAVEADRFGIVAHVLAVRDGCRISTFALIEDYWGMDWVGFVDQLTRLTKGVAFYTSSTELSSCIMESYLSGRKKKAYIA